jgi:hypothetical protein
MNDVNRPAEHLFQFLLDTDKQEQIGFGQLDDYVYIAALGQLVTRR